MDAGVGICQGEGKRHGRLSVITVEPCQPGNGLNQKVLARFFVPWAGGSITGNGSVHHAGVDGFDCLIVQSYFFHDAGTEIFNHYIRTPD